MKALNLMWNRIRKLLLLTVIVGLSAFQSTKASHAAGGEITYEWLTGNTYKIKLALYRDCSGIPFPTSVVIDYTSGCGLYGTVSLNQVGSGIPISPLCSSSVALSSCYGGALYSIKKKTYEGIITLQGTCSDWQFVYTTCCRNGGITNLVNSSTYGFYITALLNNSDVPFNNSVQFAGISTSTIYNNITTAFNWNTYDVDGDSVHYELVSARDNGFPIPYNIGYSPTQPFAVSTPTLLDPSTGILTVTPNATQLTAISVKVSEYRNGFLVGEVYRDYQVSVINDTNTPPSLTGMNGTGVFVTNGCPGDTIQFTVQSSDPDPGQNLTISMDPGYTFAAFNSSGGQYPTGTFTWYVTPADISSQPYTYTINVNDDNCDYYGTQSFAYQVYVNGCNPVEVWPGDANADGTANLYDLLAVGIANGDTGPVRPSANISWTAQPAPDWTNSFASGINYKHADTDGNGSVNLSDTTAIMQNYGMTHPLRVFPPVIQTIADLSIVASFDTVGTSTLVDFDIILGNPVFPVPSIYGLAFRLYFDAALIDTSSVEVTYGGTVLGTMGVNLISLDKTHAPSGYIDIALTRLDQTNFSGYGPVARVTIVTTDNVSGKVMLDMVPGDIVATDISENQVVLNPVSDGVLIDPNFTGITESTVSQMISVYPSPVSDFLEFNYTGKDQLIAVSFSDMKGKKVLDVNNPENKMNINLQTISSGVYLMKAVIGENTVIKKIMIF
jgi:hypothetical protein